MNVFDGKLIEKDTDFCLWACNIYDQILHLRSSVKKGDLRRILLMDRHR